MPGIACRSVNICFRNCGRGTLALAGEAAPKRCRLAKTCVGVCCRADGVAQGGCNAGLDCGWILYPDHRAGDLGLRLHGTRHACEQATLRRPPPHRRHPAAGWHLGCCACQLTKAMASLWWVELLPRVLHVWNRVELDIGKLAVLHLGFAQIDVLDDVARRRIDRDRTARAVGGLPM